MKNLWPSQGWYLVLGSICFVILALIGWFLFAWPMNLVWVLVFVTLLVSVGGVLFLGSNGRVSLKNFIPILIGVSILFPFVRLPGSVPDLRPEFVIVLTVSGLFVLSYLVKPHPLRVRYFPVYKWWGAFGFAIVLSTSYASLFKGSFIVWRDFWEIVKLALYVLLFAFVANQEYDAQVVKHNYVIALAAFGLSAVFGFLQYFHFPGVNEVISPYYAPTQVRGIVVLGRITGTMPNPNEFGALMVLASSFALSGALFLQGKERGYYWGAFLVYGVALVLTQSRSSLGAWVLMSGTVVFLYWKRAGVTRGVRRTIMVGLFLLFWGALLWHFAPERALSRFAQIGKFTEATSWQGRVEKWKVNFALWQESPWLGWGPGKAEMSTVVDNEWLLLLRRYGIVGEAIFLILGMSFFTGLSRVRKQSRHLAVVVLAIALQGTLVGYAFYMMLVPVYHTLQLASVLFLFLGMAYSHWKPKCVHSNKVLNAPSR